MAVQSDTPPVLIESDHIHEESRLLCFTLDSPQEVDCSQVGRRVGAVRPAAPQMVSVDRVSVKIARGSANPDWHWEGGVFTPYSATWSSRAVAVWTLDKTPTWYQDLVHRVLAEATAA